MPNAADLLTDHPDKSTFDLHELSRAIQACLDCAAACSTCADACISEEGVADMRTCIRLDLDCADICVATAKILARPSPGSDTWRKLVETCARACRECAEECERHVAHKHCQQCAQICRECEAACQQLLTAAA